MRLFRRGSHDEPEGRWIVIGLGNPGARYERNRHNAGYMVIALLAERAGIPPKTHKSGCLVAEASIGDQRVVLARPTSYMNESGRQVAALMRFYKAPPTRVVVVHDELDLPFGDVRVKAGGGTAGHNGLQSVASHLRSRDFARVRVGISRPRGHQDPADYVLSDFSPDQRKELPLVLERAADAVERILEAGVERAMNEVNTRA